MMMLAAVLAAAVACAGATAPAAAKIDDGYDLAVGLTDAMLKHFAPKQSSILADFIKFPSVAAMHEEHGEDTLACAEWLRANLENNLAMGDARLVDGGFRYPIVVGSTDGPGSTKPGVVIYGARMPPRGEGSVGSAAAGREPGRAPGPKAGSYMRVSLTSPFRPRADGVLGEPTDTGVVILPEACSTPRGG